MATDSTELTFVRCPSCRSLVPAVSTRCRMCGATLDASQKLQDMDTESKRSGRVRQRTTSPSDSEMAAAVERIRDEEVAEQEMSGSDSSAQKEESEQNNEQHEVPSFPADDHTIDPLSAYIEEVEIPETPEKPQEQHKEEKPEPLKGAEQSVPEAPQPIKQPPPLVQKDAEQKTPASPPERNRPFLKREESSEGQEGLSSKEGAKQMPPPRQFTEARGRVVVESGNRRMGKNLSFGKPREEKPFAGPEETKEQRQPSFQKQEPAHMPQQREQNVQGEAKMEKRDNRQEARRMNEPRAGAADSSSHHSPAESPKRDDAKAGKLLGWLVSFTNPNGTATEFREGRFFISRANLKNSDLILDHASISVPHALISASSAEGVRIQDLMSERGVFVKRKGSPDYQKLTDVVKMEHGDWIKFGEVEFLVCLVS